MRTRLYLAAAVVALIAAPSLHAQPPSGKSRVVEIRSYNLKLGHARSLPPDVSQRGAADAADIESYTTVVIEADAAAIDGLKRTMVKR